MPEDRPKKTVITAEQALLIMMAGEIAQVTVPANTVIEEIKVPRRKPKNAD